MTFIFSLALVLQLHNVGGAPPAVVGAAAIELTRSYAELGIPIEWRDGDLAAPSGIDVVVLARETGTFRRRADPVLGAAVHTPAGAGVAYVFYERVRAEAERYGVSAALILACAIEHELGHLLLPDGRHSRHGLMRASWNGDDLRRADQGQLRLSVDEAHLIRERVTGPARTPPADRRPSGSQPPVEDERCHRARE
jgi:hypothetical protein